MLLRRSVVRTALIVVGVSCVAFTSAAVGQESKGYPPNPTSAEARQESWDLHVTLQQSSPFRDLKWQRVGPRKQGGRIEAIACPPGNTSIMYVGVGSGGLWKTVNNGTTWKPVFEHQSTCAVGDVAVAESNSEVVWLGSGEVLMTPRSTLPGMGVFKSQDAGKTWHNMGLQDTHHIGRVRIDPKDEQVVYVAAIGHLSTPNQQRGVFKTIDGGESWQHVLYVDEFTAAIDLVIDPSDHKTLYATTWQRALTGPEHYGSGSGVHKSVDGGRTWTKLSGGLPSGDTVGRIAIDVATSNPQVVYALVDDKQGDALFRSDDKGVHWQRVNQEPVRASWDWCEIRVSPDNEDELYSIGQRSYVSRDGGRMFAEIGGTVVRLQPHLSRVLHLDTHALWIDPHNTDHVVFGNDGGLFVSYDRTENWLHFNNLPIAEVYAVTYDMEEPFNIYIGTQDNAALFGPSTHVPEDGGPDEWQQIYVDQWGGGDSYFTFRDPGDNDTIYYESQYGGLRRLTVSTGKSISIKPGSSRGEPPLRFAWMTPYFPSMHSSQTLHLGAHRVFKSTNRGDEWTAISPDLTQGEEQPNLLYRAITAMAESNLQEGLLYAGSDNGNLFVTSNDGQQWKAIDVGLPDLHITRVTPSPHNVETVFVTLSGMRNDDFSAYLFRSDDQGKTWKAISKGLPMESVNVIREDPRVENLLYVGTDLGVYVSVDAGQRWQSLCNDLPTAAIHDLFVHPRDNKLVIGTHGLSVFVLDATPIQAACDAAR